MSDDRHDLHAASDLAADAARAHDQRQRFSTVLDDGDVLASCRAPAADLTRQAKEAMARVLAHLSRQPLDRCMHIVHALPGPDGTVIVTWFTQLDEVAIARAVELAARLPDPGR
jgi:hypothetical protein